MVLAGTDLGFAHADADETGFLEEGVDVPHLREGLDPRERAKLACAADERGGEAGTAVGGVEHHALQEDDRLVEDAEGGAIPDAAAAEEVVPQLERDRRGNEDADADRIIAVPEENQLAGEAKVMAAVMPPSEVRPVGDGSVRQPKVVRAAEVFF